MRNFRSQYLLGLIAIGIAMMFSGCGKEKALMETIPASGGPVASINAEKFIDALEGQKYGGTLTADSTFTLFLDNISPGVRPYVRTLLTTPAIDRRCIAAFSPSQVEGGVNLLSFLHYSDIIVSFIVKDESMLTLQLGVKDAQDVSGFKAYQLNGGVMLIKDKQGWLLNDDMDAAAGKISAQLDLAASSSVASVKGINEFMESTDDIVRMIVPVSTDTPEGWTCVSLDLNDRHSDVEIDAKLLDLNGKKIPFDKYMRDIDPKLLAYLAPTDIVTLGVGLCGDTDWDAVFRYIQSVFPMSFKQRAFAGMLQTYLKRIDGTVLISAGPGGSSADFNPSQISFFVAIQLKSDQAKATLDDIEGIIKMTGLPSVKKDKEIIVQPKNDEIPSFTAKMLDSKCLVVTNRSLDQLGNNVAADVMKGNSIAVWTNIPKDFAENAYGGPGLKCKIEVESEFEMELGFNDPSLPFIEQIIKAFSPDQAPVSAPRAVPDPENDLGFTPIDVVK